LIGLQVRVPKAPKLPLPIPSFAVFSVGAAGMTLLFIVAFGWLSMRTVLLLSQVNRHSPESRLGRAFQQELRNRGLTAEPGETDHLMP
jgi:hypothetical protein